MRLLLGFAVIAAATTAVACSSPAETGDSTSTTAVPSVGHGSFAYCLSQYGVPTPAGPGAEPPAGVDRQTWETAMAECSSLAPGPGPGPAG